MNKRVASRQALDIASLLEPSPATRIVWTSDECRRIARRAAILRLRNPKAPFYKLVRQAQDNVDVLEPDRRRNIVSSTPLTHIIELVKDYGEQMIGALDRIDSLHTELTAARRAAKTFDDVLEAFVADQITPDQRELLLQALSPQDILRHYHTDEMVAACSTEQLLQTAVSRLYRECTQLIGIRPLLEQAVASATAIAPVPTTTVTAPTEPCLIVLYGVPDQPSERTIIESLPSTCHYRFVSREDHDPQRIPKNVHRVMAYLPTLSRTQQRMIVRRKSELHLPDDSVVMVQGCITTFINAIRRAVPK